jgi:hypothetical protein
MPHMRINISKSSKNCQTAGASLNENRRHPDTQ